MNRNRRPGRKFSKDEGGVSEIMGDILLVSVAVMVIGTLAAQLVDIDRPQSGKATDLVAHLEGDNLTITHMGGKPLQNSDTKIYVGIGNTVSQSFEVKDGLASGKRQWRIGETWTCNISADITKATSLGMKLFVQVIDTAKENTILNQVLLGGLDERGYPDIAFEEGSLVYSEDIPTGDDPLLISVTVVNEGLVDVQNIEVRFYDDRDLIGVNKSITTLARDGQPNDNETVSLNWTPSHLGRRIMSAKIVPKINETNLGNNYISRPLSVGVGLNLDFTKPNLVVEEFTISKERPISRESVFLKAIITNTARIPASGFTLAWGNLFEGNNNTLNITTYVGNVTYVSEILLQYEWVPSKGGLHQVWVNITDVAPDGEDVKADADPDIDADFAFIDVNVLPKVLLVDDDLAGKGTIKDTGPYMRESLRAIGIEPDMVTVSAGDGPQYTGTGVTLDDYDVVIWMTGYQRANTLTTVGASSDIANLKKYLDNNGSLWMIGQDVTNDLWNNGGFPGRTFLRDYLHVSGQTLDVSLSDQVKGNDLNNVTSDFVFNTTVRSGLSATPDLIQPDSGSISALDNATDANLSLLHHNTSGYKVANFAFDFSHIAGHSDRAILTYRIMEWFNATVFFEGDDLSVSEVTITPENPYFKQEVTIHAVIRNNGMNDLDNVKVIFKDMYLGIEQLIAPDARDRAGGVVAFENPMTLNISAYGGINITIKYWVPDQIGIHQIKVIVDPNDIIMEVNENNNEFISDLTSTEVFVDSITLIVDDDQTVSGAENTTKTVVDMFDHLNYRYELHNVSNSASDGPSISNLTRYNNVIWVLGNESALGTTLTTNDCSNLDAYLTGYQGNLWIIGQNFLDDNTVRNNMTFRRDILGINGMTRDVATPSTLMGVIDHNITHGIRYPTTTTFGNEADAITPVPGAETMLLNGTGSNFGIAFHNASGVDYKVVVSTFEFGFIDDVEDQRELGFMIFHWFEQADYRIELRVTWDDIYFGRDDGPPQAFDTVKPVLGGSYILQAKVWNVGVTPAGAVVRFLDGSTVISSASVYVPGSQITPDGDLQLGSALAEIIWTPLFAGDRPISIKVDPDMNIPLSKDPRSTTSEVLKKNNNVTRNIEVFFFYDDMETGPSNWKHETTLLHINGEQPIEYFDHLRPIDTNIIDSWESRTGNWEQLFDEGHSLPSSFKSSEPLNMNLSQIHKRVGICIENSSALHNKDQTFIRLKASWNFTNDTMGKGDELAIWRSDNSAISNFYEDEFPGNGTFEQYPFENQTRYLENNDTNGDGQGDYFGNSGLGGHDLPGCIDIATKALEDSWDDPDTYPALIVLTAASTQLGNKRVEAMMDYSRQRGVPMFMIGVGNVNEHLMYDIAMVSNGGLYFYAATGADLSGIFEILGEIIGGGGSRSIEGDVTDSTSSRAIDGRTSAPQDSSGAKVIKLYNPVGSEIWAQGINRNLTYYCNNKHTLAECTGARISFDPGTGVFTQLTGVSVKNSPYDWTSDSASYDSKADCYQYNWSVPSVTCANCKIKVEIGTLEVISGSFEIFDSGLPMGIRNANVSNATTMQIDLSDYESAKLSFWHKYDLLATENGGVILIGNSSLPNSGYQYHYVIPTRNYPGNVRLDKDIKDDDGTRIQFAYNGRSAGQTLRWAHDEVDLSPFISDTTPYIRVRFMMLTWGYGNGGGWWLDDVQVKATRSDNEAITASVADQWELYEWTSGVDPPAMRPYSGTHMWWNHDPTNGHDLKDGIDNNLMTKSIDLTNAEDAHLAAYFKFNIDDDAGRPPDGFRMEISSDNGVTWYPVNLGVRASWGTSGDWSTDGKSPDGTQAYTGIQDDGTDIDSPEWVSSDSLWRLNTELSGWSGRVIKIRFRVVTNLDPTHWQRDTVFKGFAIDDVKVYGNTTISGAPIQKVSNGYQEDSVVKDKRTSHFKMALKDIDQGDQDVDGDPIYPEPLRREGIGSTTRYVWERE